jgi:hypothetical protein
MIFQDSLSFSHSDPAERERDLYIPESLPRDRSRAEGFLTPINAHPLGSFRG